MPEDATTAETVGMANASVLVEMSAEIVAAYIRNNHVQPGDLPALISTVHTALHDVCGPAGQVKSVDRPTPPVPIRKTVTDAYIVSLEDGRHYQTLKRHPAKRGLTPEAYRQKWGLPNDYPLVAAGYARRRSELAKAIGLGNMRRKA